MEKVYDWFKEKFGWRKEEVDQNTLVAGIILVVVGLIVAFVAFTPSIKYMATVAGLWALKTVVNVLGLAFVTLGLFFAGHFVVRNFIEYLDEKRASNIALEPWVHWLLCVVLSVVVGWSWTFIVPWTVSFHSHFQTLFVNWGWYHDGVVQGLDWWWVVGSLGFFVGYFWRGIKREFFYS